jgi:hypothetical protein
MRVPGGEQDDSSHAADNPEIPPPMTTTVVAVLVAFGTEAFTEVRLLGSRLVAGGLEHHPGEDLTEPEVSVERRCAHEMQARARGSFSGFDVQVVENLEMLRHESDRTDDHRSHAGCG